MHRYLRNAAAPSESEMAMEQEAHQAPSLGQPPPLSSPIRCRNNHPPAPSLWPQDRNADEFQLCGFLFHYCMLKPQVWRPFCEHRSQPHSLSGAPGAIRRAA